jgi:hypothetical protein
MGDVPDPELCETTAHPDVSEPPGDDQKSATSPSCRAAGTVGSPYTLRKYGACGGHLVHHGRDSPWLSGRSGQPIASCIAARREAIRGTPASLFVITATAWLPETAAISAQV